MLGIKYSSEYKRSYRKLSTSGKFKSEKLERVIKILQQTGKLGIEYRDHELSGDLAGNRECHIRGDLLLIYNIEENALLHLIDLGSHSELFGK